MLSGPVHKIRIRWKHLAEHNMLCQQLLLLLLWQGTPKQLRVQTRLESAHTMNMCALLCWWSTLALTSSGVAVAGRPPLRVVPCTAASWMCMREPALTTLAGGAPGA